MLALCEHILADIALISPSDSSLGLQVELLSGSDYSARIDVRSASGSFLGRGQDIFDSVAVSQAAKNLMDSLVLWKRGKFADKSPAS